MGFGSAGSDGVFATRALSKFVAALEARDAPIVVDLGPAVGPNVTFLGDRLGCKLHVADILSKVETWWPPPRPDDADDESETRDLAAELERRRAARTLDHPGDFADGVLCWDVFDYLDDDAAARLASEVTRVLKPRGVALLCHGPENPIVTGPVQYEVVDEMTLRYRPLPMARPESRVWYSRPFTNLFAGLTISSSFLLKSRMREVVLRKPPSATSATQSCGDSLSRVGANDMARSTVALLSDFGMRDHYVGAMKGVILGICPDATLVDISHDVPAHDVLTAGLELAAVYRLFPTGTIFLVVVDPGVGSARRGLAVDTGDYRFVAPDNGVLTAVLQETPPKSVVELTERRYARPTVSKTFEGRDRFAPAAAWLGKNIQLSALGRPVTDYRLLEIPVPNTTDGLLSGQVLRIDHFGNVVSNIDRKTFESYAQVSSGGIQIEVGPHAIGRLVETYADIGDDEVCAIFGSTDHLEFAANSQSAVDRLEVERGATVTVSRDGS